MKNMVLIAAIIAHFLLVGADAFCQVAICPVVLSAPPSSLAMYQGEFAYDSSLFWRPVNMIALGLLFAALFMNWRTRRRNLLLVWLAGAIVITIVSLGFVYPEFKDIVSATFSDTVESALVDRGANWRIIALVRLVVFTGLGVLPLVALSKQPQELTSIETTRIPSL